MKDSYGGKYIELDFSHNLALRPKHEVQSAHFSGKQFSLHCAIAEPFDRRYHFHDTKHDSIFVDQVLRYLLTGYGISNEDLLIQSDKASFQYKNKNSFGLLLKLANEFNIRIIRTYGAAGHGKGAIDGMSSFGVKNIFWRDIVTHDQSSLTTVIPLLIFWQRKILSLSTVIFRPHIFSCSVSWTTIPSKFKAA